MSVFRPPLLLYSYIAAELLAPFFASFLILYGVFFLVRLIPLLEVVLDLRIGAGDFVRLFSYLFPHMLLYVIPMSCMTGVILGFTRLTNDREILALKACGISVRSMLPPVIVTCAAIALLTGFFAIELTPAGEQNMRRLMFTLAKEKIDKGLKEKTFTEALGDLVVYVDEIDADDNWHGVYVSDMRNRENPLITMAKLGKMEADVDRMMVTIVLNDGTLHNAEGVDNQVIRFQRYQLQIPLRPPTQIDGEDVTLLGRGQMSQKQLLLAADKYGPTTKQGIVFLTEYHHRFVLPVGCFLLGLLGLPLGLQAGPGRRAVGLPLGLGFFIFYYVAFTISRVMVEDLTIPLLIGMWIPNLLFLVLTLYVYWRVDREKPLLPEQFTNLIADIYDRTLHPLVRISVHALQKLWQRRPGNLQESAGTAPMLHGDPTQRIFHFHECDHYNREECTLEFRNIDVARDAGFEPCSFCKTLMYRRTP